MSVERYWDEVEEKWVTVSQNHPLPVVNVEPPEEEG